MTIISQEKTKVSKMWLKGFPHLKRFNQNSLLAIAGPFLYGVELVKIPYQDEYRPYFVLYSLLGSSLQECLNYPILLLTPRNERDLQITISYSDSKNSQKAFKLMKDQFPIESEETLESTAIHSLIEDQLKKETIKISLQQPELLELLYFSHFYNLQDEAFEVIERIKMESEGWDKKRFELLYGNFNEWLIKLENTNREDLLKSLVVIRNNKKLKKLNQVKYA